MATAGAAPEVWTAGVDWITCTAGGSVSRTNLREIGRELIREQERNGYRVKASAPQGYHGMGCEGVFVGERADGVMVRLSGLTAMYAWPDVCARAVNVSRIDLQVTVTGLGGVSLARRHHAEVLARHKRRGRPFDCRLITHNDTPQTLYIGSRQSETFARCYDKHQENPEDYPPGTWRYEAEYKGDTAGIVAAKLADTDVMTSRALALVHKTFFQRGTRPVFAPDAQAPDIRWENPAPDRERTLRWLESGVAPTLHRAQQQGWLGEAIERLTGRMMPAPERYLG